ncbi:MAG: sigma 54-interacting transcriptional regulator [Myxococcota bacterium]
MTDDTLTTDHPFPVPAPPLPRWGLAIAWSLDEPGRVGETLVLHGSAGTVGRGEGEGSARMLPWRIRPGASHPAGALATRRISRSQLEVRGSAGSLTVRNVGKTALRAGGRVLDEVVLGEGQCFELDNAMVLVAVRRSVEPPALEHPFPDFAFGSADPFGMVGESELAWRLREEIAFLAARTGHVFVTGPSGAGKELAARALHGLSDRSGWVARNAATIPEPLAEAELFGNRRDYPNPGMPDRAGLVGEAHGGTLLLDEVGELPLAVQAGLLRLLDDGEYQRLGESRTRRSSARVLGATHREPEVLKHDLLARFRHRLEVPGLERRPEDVPLLVTHLLRQARAADASLSRFFDGDTPRITPRFVQALLGRAWNTHARELDRLLWESVRAARAPFLDTEEPVPGVVPAVDPSDLTPDRIREALAACDGVVSQAWKALGLNSRDQLRRLLRKHGIQAGGAE